MKVFKILEFALYVEDSSVWDLIFLNPKYTSGLDI
jgi:hypothetical protein